MPENEDRSSDPAVAGLASEARAKLLSKLLASPALVSVFEGPDFVCKLVNESIKRLIGFDPTGKTMDELAQGQNSEINKLIKEVYRTGRARVFSKQELKVPTPTGVMSRYFSFAIHPYGGEQGNFLTGVLCIATDVTADVEVQQHAERHSAWIEGLLERIDTPVTIIEIGTGDFVYMNEAAKSLYKDRDEVEVLDAAGNVSAPSVWPAARLARGEEFQGMEVNARIEGHVRSFLVNGRKLGKDHKGREVGVLTSAEITGQKRTEVMLREAVQTRDDFLNAAAHELRTPLSSITLHVQGLRTLLPESEKLTKRLDALERAAKRMTTLMDEMLEVVRAKAERPLFIAKPQDIDLAVCTRECANRLQWMTSRCGCDVEVVGDPVLGRWDPSLVEKILSNLVTNACKYGSGKPIHIHVERSDGLGMVRVKDYGIGISDEDQARIFGRFERTRGTESYGGLGLGLWIAREAAGAMKGDLQVYSSPGKGAEFVLRLPGAKQDG